MIDARYQVGWETDHPWDCAHFQRFMTKNLLDDSNTPGMDIKGLKRRLERIFWGGTPLLRGRPCKASPLDKRGFQGGHLERLTYDPWSLVATVDWYLIASEGFKAKGNRAERGQTALRMNYPWPYNGARMHGVSYEREAGSTES